MSRTTLQLRRQPALRVDARGLLPAAMAALSVGEIEHLGLRQGRSSLPLGELFSVYRSDAEGAPELHLEGDFARFDHLGWTQTGGLLHVHGHAGDQAGGGLAGGRLLIDGNAGDMAGISMRGGSLEVTGHCGDLAASALPGDMDGMRGGSLVIRGNAGARLGDRMRRGTVVVHGDAGDYLGSRMVAGTIAVGGRCGLHPALGMRRGSIVFAGTAPEPGASFVPVLSNAAVFWQLLARDLARHGGAFAGLASRRLARLAGDLAVQGKGELLLPD